MTVHDICQLAYKYKSIFLGVYKNYKLLLTVPVTVAMNERTFSKMKIIKNFLRSTMSGERLDDLIVLATEKDLSDKIDLNMALKAWATKKNRKLKLSVKSYNSFNSISIAIFKRTCDIGLNCFTHSILSLMLIGSSVFWVMNGSRLYFT